MQKILRIDIETAPEVNSSEFWSYPKKRLWEQKMLKEPMTETMEKSYMERSSLYPEFSKVICISYLIEWGVEWSLIGEEKEILKQFNTLLDTNKDAILGGFNIFGFDVPFLWKRMIINNIKPNAKLCLGEKKSWNTGLIDVFLEWKQTSFSCSLDTLCQALLGESPKEKFDAKSVAYAYYNGAIDQIRKYCEGDVEFTRRCWWRIQLVNLAEKERYAGVIKVIDNEKELKIN